MYLILFLIQMMLHKYFVTFKKFTKEHHCRSRTDKSQMHRLNEYYVYFYTHDIMYECIMVLCGLF